MMIKVRNQSDAKNVEELVNIFPRLGGGKIEVVNVGDKPVSIWGGSLKGVAHEH